MVSSDEAVGHGLEDPGILPVTARLGLRSPLTRLIGGCSVSAVLTERTGT